MAASKRILIIESDMIKREVIREAFVSNGYEVVCPRSLQGCIDALQNEMFDLFDIIAIDPVFYDEGRPYQFLDARQDGLEADQLLALVSEFKTSIINLSSNPDYLNHLKELGYNVLNNEIIESGIFSKAAEQIGRIMSNLDIEKRS